MESADLRKDCPDVDRLLANFLSRAVIDEVLPPAFLMDRSLAEASPEVLEQAKALLRYVCARAGASGCVCVGTLARRTVGGQLPCYGDVCRAWCCLLLVEAA